MLVYQTPFLLGLHALLSHRLYSACHCAGFAAQVNEWFIENRDPETGAFPDFPAEDAGGSRSIIGPALAPRVPPPAPPQPSADPAAAKGKAGAKAKTSAVPGKASAPCTPSFGLRYQCGQQASNPGLESPLCRSPAVCHPIIFSIPAVQSARNV